MEIDIKGWENKPFTQFMAYFLDKSAYNKDVVEIGSDVQLKLALDLSNHCNTLYSVDFPQCNARKLGWYEMHDMIGVKNIILVDGNARHLSSFIEKADTIFTRRVVLEYELGDMADYMAYKRGEKELTRKEMARLRDHFQKAPTEVYTEMLKVANPGYLVLFNPADFKTTENIKTLMSRNEDITVLDLLAEPWEEIWPCVILDNTKGKPRH